MNRRDLTACALVLHNERVPIRNALAAIVTVFLLVASCATATQRATAVAVGTKQIVETAYDPWETYVKAAVARCQAELPPAEHTKSEFDACLGPAIEHERVVVPLLEAYHAAALVLFVALTTSRSDQEVDAARMDLARAVADLVRSIPGVDDRIKQVQAALGGK